MTHYHRIAVLPACVEIIFILFGARKAKEINNTTRSTCYIIEMTKSRMLLKFYCILMDVQILITAR